MIGPQEKWYVLKNRNLEGPYSASELRKGLRDGQFQKHDFVISAKNVSLGTLNYVRLSDLRDSESNFVIEPRLDDSQEIEIPPEKDLHSEPELKDFGGDEEHERTEISKIFVDKIESIDLVAFSKAGGLRNVLPPKEPSAKPTPSLLAVENFKAQSEKVFSSFQKSRLWLWMLLALLLGGGIFYFWTQEESPTTTLPPPSEQKTELKVPVLEPPPTPTPVSTPTPYVPSRPASRPLQRSEPPLPTPPPLPAREESSRPSEFRGVEEFPKNRFDEMDDGDDKFDDEKLPVLENATE